MAAIARSNSRATNQPVYKDYVNFLANYKNGKKEADEELSMPIQKLPPKVIKEPSKKTLDVTDSPKEAVISYTSHLEEKTINPVQPKIQKTELFIEIEAPKTVSQVSKIFEPPKSAPASKETNINSKISIFEKQKPQTRSPRNLAKPVLNRFVAKTEATVTAPQPPPPLVEPLPIISPPSLEPAVQIETKQSPPILSMIPPPPPEPIKKIEANTVTKYTVEIKPDGSVPTEIDKNDPAVKKLVYGALRNMYGAYHHKANDMMASLPQNRVVKSNGIQDRIDQIAANGGLDKLNGRVNPKLEQE